MGHDHDHHDHTGDAPDHEHEPEHDHHHHDHGAHHDGDDGHGAAADHHHHTSRHHGHHHHHNGSDIHFHELTVGQILWVLFWGLMLFLNWRGIFTTVAGINTAVFIVLIGGFHVFNEAIAALMNRRISAELAVAIAAIAALAIGENAAAAWVIFIMLVGHGLEDYAAAKAHHSIQDLLTLAPPTARVRRDGVEQTIPVDEVEIGDIVIVRPGESVPVDGDVTSGRSSVNQAPITGESLPVSKHPGDAVFAGTLNEAGALEITATRVGEDTTLATIVRLVEEARSRKAPVQRIADKWAAWFVPIVLLAAALTYGFTREIIRAVTVLIVACPCALVLATPTAVVCGLARLARDGVLVKGGSFLETLGEATVVLFDKTGTLTAGTPQLTALLPAPGVTEEELLALAAGVERDSEHVLGRLLVRAAADRSLNLPPVSDFAVLPGLGVTATVHDAMIAVGNRQLLSERGVTIPDDLNHEVEHREADGHTTVFVAQGGRLLGAATFADHLRDGVAETIHALEHLDIEHVAIVTGDNQRAARAMARQAGIREVFAELLPADKVERVHEYQQRGDKVMMLGDGINDAPSLAAADIGIALGGIGSDLTIESADVVFMTDDLRLLPHTIALSRHTVRLVRQNMVLFALGLNAAAVIASALGWLRPVSGAVLHEFASMFVILNSMRLLAFRRFRHGRLQRGADWIAARWQIVRGLLGQVNLHEFRHWWSHHGDAVRRSARVAVPLLYVLSGFYAVRPDEVAVVQLLGKVHSVNIRPGLHYRLPYPFERVLRVKPRLVRTIEIGFRTQPGPPAAIGAEPPAYEWNIQHRSGRYRKQPEEALMLAGDENMVEVNVVVHYDVSDPVRYLFTASDVDGIVRAAAESGIRCAVQSHSVDSVLTSGRLEIESDALARICRTVAAYDCGVHVYDVLLQDVHPPLEVVDAFRDVSSASEERATMINEAEAYANETIPLARGQAAADLAMADAYRVSREQRADGDAARFDSVVSAAHINPQVTRIQLHLKTVEEALAPLKKIILDKHRTGRRQMILVGPNGLKIDASGLAGQLGQLNSPPPSGPYQE